eukprot:g9198.t1
MTTPYGSSRRKTYGGKDWRILGVNALVSHPRLGFKNVSLHPEVKTPFKVAVHSLDIDEVKKAIHTQFKYERTSKTRLVISAAGGTLADGLDVNSDKQLINHFIKWDDGYNDRLYNYLSHLVNQCKNSFQSDSGNAESVALKSILTLHQIAFDEDNHVLLYDESLLAGLIKMSYTKTFLLNIHASLTLWYLLTKTDDIIRKTLFKVGIIGGLIRSIKETKFNRADDEIKTEYAIKCLLGEVQTLGVEEFIGLAKPITADQAIEIMLQYIKKCKRIDTSEYACALSCYLLPFGNVKTLVQFGLELIYEENPDTAISALYAVALGMSYREGRKSLNDLGGNKLFQKISEIGIDLQIQTPVLLTDEIKIIARSNSMKHVWTLDESVFGPRKRITDSKDFYDTPKVKKKAFKIDWANATAKKRFVNFILREDDDGGKEELYEVRDVIWECYDIIMDAYEFYSVAGSSLSSCYTITLNSYSDFVADCKIPDNKSKTCKRKDLDTIFIVANVEEDKSSKVNKTNDDRALMRFEFLEVVIRIAVQKYLRSGDTDDVSDAVRMLCEQNIKPNLDDEAIHDSNQFRKHRLYFEDVDKCMKKHMSRLKMIFKVFAKPKVGFTKFDLMDMEEWFFLLKCCDLFDEDFTQREGKLAFAWAQMAVADEVRRRLQFKCITFEDFLEALARVCDMKALPTDDDILKAGVKTTGEFFKKMTEMGLLDDFCRENPCHWNGEKTRRMGELLPKFFDLIFTKLDRDGDGDFDKSDLQKWVAQGNAR